MLRLAVLWVLVLPGVGAAQSGPAEGSRTEEIAAIRAAIAGERARLDELERRLTALDGAPPVREPAAVTAPAEQPAASPSRFEFYGESTLRSVSFAQSYAGCEACPSRFRERMRLRLGVEGRLAPGLRVVSGLGIGDVNEPNTTFQTLTNKMSRKVATYERAYLAYQPARAPWLDLTAGKFPYVWTRSTMTFDIDLFPEGFSQLASFDFSRDRGLQNASVQGLQLIVNESAAGKDTTILGGQAAARLRVTRRWTVRPVATFFDFRQPDSMVRAQLSGADVGTRNTNAVVMRDGVPFYASRFRYVNGIVENAIVTKSAAWPLAFALEYQRNTAAVSDRNSAQSIRFDAGRQDRRGDWFLSWHTFRVEQDAIISSLGESDWRAPSNVLQHRAQVVRTLHPNVLASWTLYRGRTLDSSLSGALLAPGLAPGRRDPWVNQMYFDIIYRY